NTWLNNRLQLHKIHKPSEYSYTRLSRAANLTTRYTPDTVFSIVLRLTFAHKPVLPRPLFSRNRDNRFELTSSLRGKTIGLRGQSPPPSIAPVSQAPAQACFSFRETQLWHF
ncbi:7351_t:CDS:2, partial [Racocetra persica]